MSTGKLVIRPIKDRHFALIPIDQIVVVNSRRRDEERFQASVQSIAELGLYKPICVNARRLKKTGKYELVCGEGRLAAYRQLEMTHIEVEIIDVDDERALLIGLAENFTRAPKSAIDFARRIHQMHANGMTFAELARITRRSLEMMRTYVALMEKGEERLIRGVEEGVFSISFALKIVESSQSEVQHFLMDEHLNGKLSTLELGRIMKILKERESNGLSNADMTMKKLKGEMRVKIKEHKMLCEQGKIKRDDVLALNDSLRILWKDEKFKELIGVFKDLKKPELKGSY